jgi:DNA-binding CsgD family transcriptional regulator
VLLIGRPAEKQALHEVLETVRAGTSGALVLRGEPGVGKSALLGYAIEHATDLQILRMVAVEPERTLGFAAVHQLLVPLLPAVDRLPEPQRRALGVAFGLVSGPPADPFLVGLAVLTLLADAGEVRPVLCVIDDAHWLDEESADVLSFVARRLRADRVGLLFALRDTTEPDPRLAALPGLRVTGLPEQDARELLETSIAGSIDAGVAARVIADTGGNPLAVVEAARALTTEQRCGRAPLPDPLPVGHRLEGSFVRQVRELPADTQALLLVAAADRPGRAGRLWQAGTALGIPGSAAAPAEAAGLASFWPEVRFSHPLVRSAVYHAATAVQRRQAHRALARACDPELDAVPRAWHLAAAAAVPDEGVAAELEAAADRAGSRGGYAATAALLERAAQLTPDDEARAERHLCAAQAHVLAGTVDRADALLVEATTGLRDPLSAAQAIRLRGRIQCTRGQVADAVSALVRAAERLLPLDPRATRDALLSALEAAVFAGWAPNASLLAEVARTARDLQPPEDPAEAAADLLLRGYTARLTDGYAAGVPALRRSFQAFLADDMDPDAALRRLELTAIAAADLLDDASVERLTTRWIERARARGALARLAGALAFRSVFVDGPGGRLTAAETAEAEARELGEITHNPAIVPPTGAHTLLTLALSGREAEARATAEAVAREAPSRGAAGEAALAAYGLGVLEISLGNYGSAVRCLEPAYIDDTPLIGTQALPDLVEAAVRAGRRDLAERALARLAERANATGTFLARGLLARARALTAAPAEARRDYEDALHLLGQTRAAPQLARAHLLYGEWLRRQRRRRDARDQLRPALDMLDRMGLRCFAERARVELRATGERARKRAVGTPEQLTPQEEQIAALVSRGEANRAIAAQLFVSPSTVEYHLHKVFRKLGVTSRTQLAHRVHEGLGPVDGSPSIGVRPLPHTVDTSAAPGRRRG